MYSHCPTTGINCQQNSQPTSAAIQCYDSIPNEQQQILDYFMASGSLIRKKKNYKQRTNLNPSPPMASRPNPSSYFQKSSLLLSLVLLLSVIVLLGISSNIRNKFVRDDSFPKIYTIEVVNEFPHDPDAFTQVPPCFRNVSFVEHSKGATFFPPRCSALILLRESGSLFFLLFLISFCQSGDCFCSSMPHHSGLRTSSSVYYLDESISLLFGLFYLYFCFLYEMPKC